MKLDKNELLALPEPVMLELAALDHKRITGEDGIKAMAFYVGRTSQNIRDCMGRKGSHLGLHNLIILANSLQTEIIHRWLSVQLSNIVNKHA